MTQIHTVYAFTAENHRGGNPAGVILNAERLSKERMQALASEAGYPETAFVTRIENARVYMRFFTPNKEIADCGHATVAAFSLLKHLGQIEQGVYQKVLSHGLRTVEVREQEIALQCAPPTFNDAPKVDPVDLQHALGLTTTTAFAFDGLSVTSVGAPFLLIDASPLHSLTEIQPDFRRTNAISESLDVIGFYVYQKTFHDSFDIAARMFAPRFAIDEESATGMAAGALMAALHRHTGKTELTIAQGDWMSPPSPSRIYAQVKDFTLHTSDIWVSGQARI